MFYHLNGYRTLIVSVVVTAVVDDRQGDRKNLRHMELFQYFLCKAVIVTAAGDKIVCMVLLNERFKLVQMVIRMDEDTCNKDLLGIFFLEICKIGCFTLAGKRPGAEKIKYNDRLGDLFKKKLIILNGNGMKYSLFISQAEIKREYFIPFPLRMISFFLKRSPSRSFSMETE